MRSPSIFTTSLRQQCLGLSINSLFLGAFSHADGIRTYKYSRCQAAEVNSFTNARGLSLCLDKCAVLSSSHTPISQDCITIGDTQLPIETAVKCLGVWWDFSPARSLLMKEYTRLEQLSSRIENWGSFMGSSIHSPQGVLLRAVSFQFSCMVQSHGLSIRPS